MKSIELNWIRNVDKSLFIPEVVVADEGVSGHYLSPLKEECYLDGGWFDRRFGIIVISPDQAEEEVEGTLAHEWRHHWQECHGWKYDGVPLRACGFEKSYDAAIIHFFTKSASEMDAFCFELVHGNANVNDSWFRLLEPALQ